MSETDRELLELAAKAASFGAPGTGAVCWTESEYPKGSGKNGALWNYVKQHGEAKLWNPLTDDGDALRLAVDLQISVMQWRDGVSATHPPTNREYAEQFNGDPYSDTRRAIVRAAAEIGRAMP